MECRCGWNRQGDHPCHGKGYTCRKPAKSRFVARPACLSGSQPKFGAYETFACDQCWEEFQSLLKDME